MKQAMTVAALIDLFPDRKVRKQIRCAAQKLGSETMSLPAQTFADSLEEMLTCFDAPEQVKSASVYRCHLRKLIRWAVEERLVNIAPPPKDSGYPTYQQFLGSCEKRSTVPRTVWNHFQHFVSARRIECFKIEASHLDEFREWLAAHVSNFKGQWNLFSRQWNELANAGLVPNIRTNSYQTSKRARYAISIEDLPGAFQEELQAARRLVVNTRVKGRKGKRPLAGSTVALRDDILLRYLGWLRDKGHELGARTSLADWIQEDLIDVYLAATNIDGDGLADMGRYQRTILLNLEQHMRHGFLRSDKATLLQDKRLFYDKRFHVRREASKKVVPLNDVYVLISRLLEQANCPMNPVSPLTRALAVRDAVAILLLATFGYRRTIVTKLHIGTTIRRVNENGTTRYLVLVPKRLTKPRLRDGYYEVPEHFTWLLDFYCYIVRPYLLGKQEDDGYLLLEQSGGALSGASLYRIMADRSSEVLDTRVNPHMLRKSLATEWFELNSNDLLTLSLIMDCSVHTLDKNYALSKTKTAVEKFDNNIQKQLVTRRPNGAAPPAGYENRDMRQKGTSATGGRS